MKNKNHDTDTNTSIKNDKEINKNITTNTTRINVNNLFTFKDILRR